MIHTAAHISYCDSSCAKAGDNEAVRAGNEVLDDVPQSPSVGKKGPDQEKPGNNNGLFCVGCLKVFFV